VRTVAFDKTGTLTAGRPQVTDVLALGGAGERTVLGLAAAVEAHSSHPLAVAIVAHAGALGIPLRPVAGAKAELGRSVSARVAGALVEVASPRLVAGLPPVAAEAVQRLEASGKTIVAVVRGGEPAGLIALRDEPREDAADGVAALRALGVSAVMLSGDNRRAAQAVGGALGVEVQAELLPQDKLEVIGRLRRAGPVAMVGDGVNDAPALAAADVGIAMGGGTDVALETADAGLLHDRVGDVARLIGLSRAALANIHQNIAVSLGFKALFLATTLAGLTGLWPAILADTGATVLVTLNALRLLRWRG
jgi:Cd2+/Zn2+-exporting ATPase